MAPRRSRGDSYEGTIELSMPEEYRPTYTASAVVLSILAVACFVLFTISLYIYQRHWRKKLSIFSNFMLALVFSTLFRFVSYALSIAAYVCTLNEATVLQSWVLVGPWISSLFFVAEFSLLEAMYYILHNRLRTVTISKPTTGFFSFINWSLYAVCMILWLVWLADQWAYSVLQLADLKADYYSYYTTSAFEKFIVSDFHVHHAKRIIASAVVFRFIIQVWLIVLGVIAIVKSPKEGVSAQAREATLVFFVGIFSYVVAPMTALILTFKYWEYSPDWVPPVEASIEGIILVITTSALCIFAKMLSPVHAPDQWDLGTRKYAAAANMHQDYYNQHTLATDTVNTPGVGVGTSFPQGAGRY